MRPLAVLALTHLLALVAPREASLDTRTPHKDEPSIPVRFVENGGRVDPAVRFLVRGADRTLYFTPNGVTIARSDKQRRWTARLEFLGADPAAAPLGRERARGIVSVFRGRPAQWKTGLSTYRAILYHDLWPGIDLEFQARTNAIKYEFRVRPGADPHRIRIAYRGVTDLRAAPDGALVVETPLGPIEDGAPIAFTIGDNSRRNVRASYHITHPAGKDKPFVLSLDLGQYDPGRTLIVDPQLFLYSGFIGGEYCDWAEAVAVDDAGCAYVAGTTQSPEPGFPVAVGPDLTFNGSLNDAFIAKIDPTGSELLYCGFLGGDGDDFAMSVAVDAAGNAYIAGETSSSEATFPVLVGPDLTYNGYHSDGFVAKVNVAGTALEYCGYVGGAYDDDARGIAVDSSQAAYLTGSTDSDETTFPVVIGPDLTFNEGWQDAYVAKVAPDGTSLLYCGYIGGGDLDDGNGIAVDPTGAAYVAGSTRSSENDGFPLSVGPDLTFNGVYYDAYVAKVAPDGTSLLYCGYIGGGDNEFAYCVAADAEGRAFVGGETASDESTFPVLSGPGTTLSGIFDGFVAEVSSCGENLLYAGYIGGSEHDIIRAIDVDARGCAYAAGGTDSSEATFPVSEGPDLSFNGGEHPPQYDFPDDAFVAKITPDGSGLVLCGYVGGSGDDDARGIAVDAAGNLFVAGGTNSTETSFPVAVGPDLSANGGTYWGLDDAFVAKLPPMFGCEAGTVNLASGDTPADVLTINGSPGDPWRSVAVAVGDPIDVHVTLPPEGPDLAPFALYVWIGPPRIGSIRPQPKNLGEACLPTPLSGGAPPPKKVWNNIGKTPYLGEPDFPSDPAPSTPLHLPGGLSTPMTLTFQGFILDDGSAANKPASVTNAVVLEVF